MKYDEKVIPATVHLYETLIFNITFDWHVSDILSTYGRNELFHRQLSNRWYDYWPSSFSSYVRFIWWQYCTLLRNKWIFNYTAIARAGSMVPVAVWNRKSQLQFTQPQSIFCWQSMHKHANGLVIIINPLNLVCVLRDLLNSHHGISVCDPSGFSRFSTYWPYTDWMWSMRLNVISWLLIIFMVCDIWEDLFTSSMLSSRKCSFLIGLIWFSLQEIHFVSCTPPEYKFTDGDIAGAVIGSILCTLVATCCGFFAFYWFYIRKRDGKIDFEGMKIEVTSSFQTPTYKLGLYSYRFKGPLHSDNIDNFFTYKIRQLVTWPGYSYNNCEQPKPISEITWLTPFFSSKPNNRWVVLKITQSF